MTSPNKVLLEKAEKVGLKVASGNSFLGGYIGCEIDKNKFVKEKFVLEQYILEQAWRNGVEGALIFEEDALNRTGSY